MRTNPGWFGNDQTVAYYVVVPRGDARFSVWDGKTKYHDPTLFGGIAAVDVEKPVQAGQSNKKQIFER